MQVNNNRKTIKSFVLRTGRITLGQQQAIDNYWQKFGINVEQNSKLDFSAIFANKKPVTVEIGFGTGDSLVKMAIENPNRNFIGIEVYKSGIGKILQNIYTNNLNNLRIINKDAVEILTNNIIDSSISCVQIFFPDPWPKKRHHKRRIVNHTLVKLLAKKIISGGILHLATDWEPYAQSMQNVLLEDVNFKQIIDPKNEEYLKHLNMRPHTKFESRGTKLGHKITDLIFKLESK